MKLKIYRYAWIALIVSGAITTCFAQIQSSTDAIGSNFINETQPTQAPQLLPGLEWTYRRVDLWKNEEIERFTQTLVSEEPSYWAVRWAISNSKIKDRIGVTPEVIFKDSQAFDDPLMTGRHLSLQFPLVVGKTWTFGYKYQSKPDTLVIINQSAKVKGWETITVPAGRFKVMRVEHEGRYNAEKGSDRWSGRIQEIFWYSPVVRRIVAHEYSDTTGSGQQWDKRRDELVSGSYK